MYSRHQANCEFKAENRETRQQSTVQTYIQILTIHITLATEKYTEKNYNKISKQTYIQEK